MESHAHLLASTALHRSQCLPLTPTTHTRYPALLIHEGLDTPERQSLTQSLAELDTAELQAEPAHMAHALTQVAQSYAALNMQAHRRWYLKQALRFSSLLGAVDTSIDLLCALAEAFIELGDDETYENIDDARHNASAREQARDRVYEAARLARRSADPQWEVTVLMRVSELLSRMGDHDDAMALQRRALALIGNSVAHTAQGH